MTWDYNPPREPFDILHADHEILVVGKPAGLLSVPGKEKRLSDCLLARVQLAFPNALLVHRLDRDTSGAIIFGLTRHAQRHLGLQFEKRRVGKTYLARVKGKLEPKTGFVDRPLAVDWPRRPLQKICMESGRSALTEWKIIKHSDDETRVHLFPKTGRSHQLRVHMKSIGHPILGDPLYSDMSEANYDRMMLHSEVLHLRHPDGGRWMKFRSKPPF